MGKPPPAADDSGDTPIDIRAFQFSVREASALIGVTEKRLYNWELYCENLTIGQRSRTRRIRFSVLDLIALHIMDILTARLGMDLPYAGKIASFAAEMVLYQPRDAAGALQPSPLGSSILVGFDDDGNPQITTANLKFPGHYLPPSYETDPAHPLRKPHITIPVAAITRNIIERVSALGDSREPDDG